MNYYSFHIGDYASHTAHLSPMEDLAYRRMLDMYYRTQKPLPADTAQIARHIRLGDNIAAIQVVLDEFFELGPDGWANQRAEKEIASYKRMADGGAKGAAKRWAKGRHSQGIATPSPPHANPNANQEPRTSNQEPVTKEKPRKRVTRPDDVEEQVWNDWLALRKAKRAPVTDTVLDGARREADKAGMRLEDFLRVWCRRGSQGLEAAWLKEHERPGFTNHADVARVTVPSKPDRDPVLVKLEQEALRAVGPTPEQRARMEELRRQARVSTDTQPHKTA